MNKLEGDVTTCEAGTGDSPTSGSDYVSDLKQRIIATTVVIVEDMLLCVWNELDYRIDMSCDIRLTHVEFVTLSYKLKDIYQKQCEEEKEEDDDEKD